MELFIVLLSMVLFWVLSSRVDDVLLLSIEGGAEDLLVRTKLDDVEEALDAVLLVLLDAVEDVFVAFEPLLLPSELFRPDMFDCEVCGIANDIGGS